MSACVFGGYDFPLYAALSKAWTDDNASHAFKALSNIIRCHLLAVDEMNLRLHVVVDTSQIQTFTDALVGILQVVFPHQSDVNLTGGMSLFVKEVVPRLHGWRFSYWYAYLAHNGRIESLLLHTHRHFIDAGHILALHHALQIDITKRCHLHAHRVIKVAFGTKHKDVRLDTHRLQFLY